MANSLAFHKVNEISSIKKQKKKKNPTVFKSYIKLTKVIKIELTFLNILVHLQKYMGVFY